MGGARDRPPARPAGHRRRRHRRRHRAGRGGARTGRHAHRRPRPGVRHVEVVVEAGPRRAALPGIGQRRHCHAVGPRTRHAHGGHRPAPGPGAAAGGAGPRFGRAEEPDPPRRVLPRRPAARRGGNVAEDAAAVADGQRPPRGRTGPDGAPRGAEVRLRQQRRAARRRCPPGHRAGPHRRRPRREGSDQGPRHRGDGLGSHAPRRRLRPHHRRARRSGGQCHGRVGRAVGRRHFGAPLARHAPGRRRGDAGEPDGFVDRPGAGQRQSFLLRAAGSTRPRVHRAD